MGRLTRNLCGFANRSRFGCRPRSWANACALAVALTLACPGLGGCAFEFEDGQGEGPGHRQQVLGLSPAQELQIGREAYQEILAKYDVLPRDHPDARRLRTVGRRLVEATKIRPLLREINLHEEDYEFEWEFHVLDSNRINAFCLPGGKVGVFTALLQFVDSDDELVVVVAHEMAHALVHHASERIALNPDDSASLRAAGGKLANLDERRRGAVVSLLSAGAALEGLAYNRFQESEADHIGVFLMTFAGYDPEAALAFWSRMRDVSAGSAHLPEILSDHPTDARRLAQLQQWVPMAEGGKKAFDAGRIAPEAAALPVRQINRVPLEPSEQALTGKWSGKRETSL